MPKRELRIVKQTPPAIGVCERCNAQFKDEGIQAQFDAHKCKPIDSSQNALRIGLPCDNRCRLRGYSDSQDCLLERRTTLRASRSQCSRRTPLQQLLHRYATEVIVKEVERNLVRVVLKLLAESVCQSRETSHSHSHGKVLPFHVAGGDVLRIRLTAQISLSRAEIHLSKAEMSIAEREKFSSLWI
jgi:hypothetical protein